MLDVWTSAMQFIFKRDCTNQQLCKTLVFLLVAAIVLTIYLNLTDINDNSRRIIKPCKKGRESASRFFSTEMCQEDCFNGNSPSSFSEIFDFIDIWSKNSLQKCKILYEKFETIYTIDRRYGEIVIPSLFSKQVLNWLSNSSQLYRMIENQTIYHIINNFAHEHTAFNLLRSKRPTTPSKTDPWNYIYNLSEERRKGCNFCQYEEMTAKDVFGRVKGKHSGSAANAFKLDKWHSLILTEKHNALELTEDEFVDWFNTSLVWFHKVHEVDDKACFPMMIWDNLPHAGASQFHPHIHTIMGVNHYHGSLKTYQIAAQLYYKDTGYNYWSDIINIHDVFGLSVHLGTAVALAPLTSRKDHEILIISTFPNMDLFRLLYYVIQTYHNELSSYCYSSGMAFPIVCPNSVSKASDSLPAIIRIGTRGDCQSMTSDTSSLELYFMYNVNVDPYIVISKLNKTVTELSKISLTASQKVVKLYDDP